MNIFVNYLFRFAFILLAAWSIRNAIVAYHDGYYFLCGLGVAFTVYLLIYLVKVVFDI